MRKIDRQNLSSLRRGAVCALTFCAVLVASVGMTSSVGFSQAPAPVAPAPAPIIVGRSMTVETVIVVVMLGAALFAICRGSRRN